MTVTIERGSEVDNSSNFKPKSDNPIPDKYQGLPSGMVKELGGPKEIIDLIRTQELKNEEEINSYFQERYRQSPKDEQEEYYGAQKEAFAILSAYVRGEQSLQGLSVKDSWLMAKLQDLYEGAKEKNQSQSLTFAMGDEVDRRVYQNMMARMTFDIMERRNQQRDSMKVARLQQEILNSSGDGAEREGSENFGNEKANEMSRQLVDKMVKSGIIKQKYEADHLDIINKSKTKDSCLYKTISYAYRDIREARYPDDAKTNIKYNEAFDYANVTNNLPHQEQAGWIYRGIFPSKSRGISTVTRGSMNAEISLPLIKDLDALITSGVVKANYKFSAPDGPGSSSRHDSVNMYFLEEPSDDALKKIAAISQKYQRGGNLVGKKISEGFYMSEIGSISDEHALKFLNDISAIDPELGQGISQEIKKYSAAMKGDRVAMSEGGFYAIQKALECYGYRIEYARDKGIIINTMK
jgi:hypothetical protein